MPTTQREKNLQHGAVQCELALAAHRECYSIHYFKSESQQQGYPCIHTLHAMYTQHGRSLYPSGLYGPSFCHEVFSKLVISVSLH